MYLALYDWDSLPTLGNNTGVWIMYLGLYDRDSLPTLGTTQVSVYLDTGIIWEQHKCIMYLGGNHSLPWEQYRCLDNVFGII